MHLVVINPYTGFVEWAKCFDTYQYAMDLDNFIDNDIILNYIIVVACKDDMSRKLSDHSKMWLKDMGSDEVWNLEYR